MANVFVFLVQHGACKCGGILWDLQRCCCWIYGKHKFEKNLFKNRGWLNKGVVTSVHFCDCDRIFFRNLSLSNSRLFWNNLTHLEKYATCVVGKETPVWKLLSQGICKIQQSKKKKNQINYFIVIELWEWWECITYISLASLILQ